VIRKLVDDPSVTKRLDDVALVSIELLAKRFVAVTPVELLFVVEAKVAVRLVPVALPNESTVVVADEAKRLVAVALVAVRLVKNPDTAVRKVEKMLVEVAKVVDAFVATRVPVVVALLKRAFVAKRLDDDANVVDALVAAKLVVVPLVKNVDEANVTPVFEIPKSVVPVDEATLNGLRLDVDVACTLNA
jgi:hypothetical protein